VIGNAGMRSPSPLGWSLPACALAALLAATPARAEDPAPPPADPFAPAAPPAPKPPPIDVATELRALERSMDFAWRLLGSVEFGRGLRFNNPYRLATELGDSARSLSLTAPYVDLGAGATFGPPDGLQYGGAVHASFALAGVEQAVITPSFLVAYRGPHAFMGYGRLGPSFILTPDPTFGGEVAGGFAWFITGKIAIAAELVFDVYYGAGTNQVAVATYPILSGQIGLLFDQEFLP
jgi:hypothetical protein